MVETTVARYLAAVDTVLPGFVELLYLTGSIALDAYQPGVSDIDTLIVTSRRPSPEDLAALATVHANMPPKPHLDGVYLDRETFRQQPADCRVVPFVVDGRFRTDQPCGDLNPVLWLVLTKYGQAVRGPAVADLGLTVDHDELRRFNLDNLATFWLPLAANLRAAVADAPDDTPAEATRVGADGVVWCALGPARLHFTLAHEDIVSKAGAAAYLAEILPAYAPLADRALRWRRGEPVALTAADARAAADSVEAVVADAFRRWA
ncbi:Nucleotidyltransferase domain-containing protein [Micromonospora pallida]|uniref:Nucleotidyltransferase domain-containing protein n=2 Tax=Micromonospora pallida TaxID=145854 RepID=A0A1C6T0R0_9ACTN|nr:Nucleotidyltransferase domain-containing protein [Micromonospora pallida]